MVGVVLAGLRVEGWDSAWEDLLETHEISTARVHTSDVFGGQAVVLIDIIIIDPESLQFLNGTRGGGGGGAADWRGWREVRDRGKMPVCSALEFFD